MGEEIGYPYIKRICYEQANDSFDLVKSSKNSNSINKDTFRELAEILELNKMIIHKDSTVANLTVCYYK